MLLNGCTISWVYRLLWLLVSDHPLLLLLLLVPAQHPSVADIVFFGEPLPARFHRRRLADLQQADLLIVMGTSLVVQPFASMIGKHRTAPQFGV